MEREVIQQWFTEQVARELSRPLEQVETELSFFELGLDSVAQLTLTGDLGEWLGMDFPETLLQSHENIAAVAQYLASLTDRPREVPWTPRYRVDPLPVSFSQERILKFSNLGAAGDRNLVNIRFIIRGSLAIPALRKALTEMVRRHEILRTSFGQGDEGFFQRIGPPVTPRLELIDVAGMLDPEPSAYAMSQVYLQQPMHLATGPLFRTLLFKLAEGVHGLTLIFHHVLIDARSLDIFQQQLSQLYAGYCAGVAPTLPEPTLQMADFALWERESLRPENQSFQAHLQWWRHYLEAPLPPPLKLPIEWQTPPKMPPSIADCIINLPIPDACSRRILKVARENGTTSFVLCFSAFALLLQRITGLNEFLVGMYLSDRKRTVAQEMIGMFAAMVPARIQADSGLTMREFVQSLHQQLMQIRQHQELPFEELQVHLRTEGQPVPEIQMTYNHHQETLSALQLPCLEIARWRESTTSEMPWGFQFVVREINELPSKITAAANGNIYNSTKLHQMADDYLDLLASMTNHLDQPVSAPVHNS